MAERSIVGTVTHYFGRIGVAVVSLRGVLKVGDSIEIEGGGAKLAQKVASMQMNHKSVDSCKAGDEVGLKVDGKVHEGATVYKVS
jgi:translation elongation factor EF-Tu-like GTPase